MLTRYSPARLAVLAAAVAIPTAVVILAGETVDGPAPAASPPTDGAPVDRADVSRPRRPTSPSTPSWERSSTSSPDRATTSPPAPRSATVSTPPPAGPTAHPEPPDPDGRTPTSGLQQLAAARVVADATGVGRDRWPDLTGPVCCTDITVTGAATTDKDRIAATVVVTWVATALNGTELQSATTTRWVRQDGSWHPVTPTPRGGVDPGSSKADTTAATPATTTPSPAAATTPTGRTTATTTALLRIGLVAASADDNRHTPLKPSCEDRPTYVRWGYDQIKSAEGAPKSTCRWRPT